MAFTTTTHTTTKQSTKTSPSDARARDTSWDAASSMMSSMTTHPSSSQAPATATEDGCPSYHPTRRTASAWACLLLSADESRRHELRLAAIAAGWDPIECRSIGDASRRWQRWRTQFAVIDLGSMAQPQKAAYMQFADSLASRERLLLVCDEPSHDAECHDGEIRARQAGAWLYVPSPDFCDGLRSLFSEAKSIAEKIHQESPVTSHYSS